MYNLIEMSKAESRVFVVANADGTDAEFIPMDALEEGFQGLSARKPGMNGHLAGVGVAGLVDDVPVVQLRQDPDDFMVVVRLTAAFSQYVVNGRAVPNAARRRNRMLVTAWFGVRRCMRFLTHALSCSRTL